jgi:hypothetical protein
LNNLSNNMHPFLQLQAPDHNVDVPVIVVPVSPLRPFLHLLMKFIPMASAESTLDAMINTL